jgi:hypothetical protein
MGIFAVFIGGPSSVFGWILVTVMGLVVLFLLTWKRWPRPQLHVRKGTSGWEVHASSPTSPTRSTSQAALLSRLLIGAAVIVAMWWLLRSR